MWGTAASDICSGDPKWGRVERGGEIRSEVRLWWVKIALFLQIGEGEGDDKYMSWGQNLADHRQTQEERVVWICDCNRKTFSHSNCSRWSSICQKLHVLNSLPCHRAGCHVLCISADTVDYRYVWHGGDFWALFNTLTRVRWQSLRSSSSTGSECSRGSREMWMKGGFFR